MKELSEKNCPLCRTSYEVLVEFPSPLKDPKEWYVPICNIYSMISPYICYLEHASFPY